jgi:autoinducer 2-degrading protein
MAYTFLSRFRIKPECEHQFVTAAKKMEQQAVEEPGVLHFQFFRLGEPHAFAVFESFVDESADRAHMEYEQNKPLITEMIACMEDGYEREILHDLEPEA